MLWGETLENVRMCEANANSNGPPRDIEAVDLNFSGCFLVHKLSRAVYHNFPSKIMEAHSG